MDALLTCVGADGKRMAVGPDWPMPVVVSGGDVGGGLTDAQLRASAVPVTFSGTVNLAVEDIDIGWIKLRGGDGAYAADVDSNKRLKVDGSGTTQPVSAAALPLPAGAATETTVGNINTSLGAKLDTLATAQANAGSDASKVLSVQAVTNGKAFPVTGTFWPITQPVSGTFWPVTQPVSGTFWQATQPVSIASMPSTPVTGSFWQATQPVSIASMPSTPVTGTFWQATQPVSGTFWQSTQPVSLTGLPALVAGSALIGKVGIDQTTPGTTNVVEEGGRSFLNIAANATTTVKSGAGVLRSITINKIGSASTATIYDNTAGSGTKIGTINTAGSQTTLLYDLKFSTGLTIVTAGTTAGDMTVVYR